MSREGSFGLVTYRSERAVDTPFLEVMVVLISITAARESGGRADGKMPGVDEWMGWEMGSGSPVIRGTAHS